MSDNRERFSSRLGFILAAAGSAVGIGNLVGFPVSATKNGGGAFLLIYALFVVFICLPVMMAEMAMGRNAQKDPLGSYKLLANNDKKWKFAGFLVRFNSIYDCRFLYGNYSVDFWLLDTGGHG
ncbi:neurotransmitter:Na+ symporter, NSS family [Pseudoalteromonas sp. BSi20480]|nr:neurotransmitter:Na+ symporter, NSS family [Pseudoalteromonas sp. BSi20480]